MVVRPHPLRSPRWLPPVRRFEYPGDVPEDQPAAVRVPGVDVTWGAARDLPIAGPES